MLKQSLKHAAQLFALDCSHSFVVHNNAHKPGNLGWDKALKWVRRCQHVAARALGKVRLDPGAVVHFDLGALCYGIVLAAWDRGLGTVINGQGIMRSDIVREVADIPDNEVIMTCVAMGYPDDSFAANTVRADREEINSFVRFVGF